jgi:hypothetical protein
MLLSGSKFQSVVENRFKINLDEIEPLQHVSTLFQDLSPWIDTNVYVKLLSFAESPQFVRFVTTCLAKYFPEEFSDVRNSAHTQTLDILHGNPRLQLICIACIQYYFA